MVTHKRRFGIGICVAAISILLLSPLIPTRVGGQQPLICMNVSTPNGACDGNGWIFGNEVVPTECMRSGAVFRDRDTTRYRLLTTGARSPIVIPDVHPVDARSVVTSKEYLFFRHKDPPATPSALPDWPETTRKRAAHRVPPEAARESHFGDLPDPREFFKCSMSGNTWEEANVYIETLTGTRGLEKQQRLSELKISVASRGDRKWYRIQHPIKFHDGHREMVMSTWASDSGFNPVSLTFEETVNGANVVRTSKRWKWKQIEGIFIPTFFAERSYPPKPGDLDTFKRIFTMKQCTLNQPFDPDAFTYKALGLKSGDLILDDIERTVFIMRDDKPERLAAYNEPYTRAKAEEKMRTGAPERSTLLKWVIAGNVVAAAAVLAFVIYRKLMSRRADKQ